MTLEEQIEYINQRHKNGVTNPTEIFTPENENPPQYSNENDIPTLLGAFGLGGANMLNNTIFGGLGGQVLGWLGSGVEAVSPFSGGTSIRRCYHIFRLATG